MKQQMTGILLKLSVVMLGLILGSGCGSTRIKDIAQKDRNRSEAQIAAERLLKEGGVLFDKGELGRAQKKFLGALEAFPELAKTHLQLADVYLLEGDKIASLAENAAFTETGKTERLKIDRMADYLFGKFARNPAARSEVKPAVQALGMLAMSQAIDAHRRGDELQALKLLDKAQKGLPRAGLIDYVRGQWLLNAGQIEKAYVAFDTSVSHNGYFAKRLLGEGLEKKLPALRKRLTKVLAAELKAHPADQDSAVLLGALLLQKGDGEGAVKAVREAMAWAMPRWDLLLVKAAGYALQNKQIHMEQALADLKALDVDLSETFSLEWPSLFHGVLADSQTEFIEKYLFPQLEEPSRSYFNWRWLQERQDPKAPNARQAFLENVASYYPEGTFPDAPTAEPPVKAGSLSEYMGAIQNQIDDIMGSLWACDDGRRSKRALASGRVMLRVEANAEGMVAQISVIENTTKDSVLAYCAVRKLLDIRLPKALRKFESFKMPIVFGPETDGLRQADKQGAENKEPKAKEDIQDGR
ncbi:MAG: hypothetical protein JRF33_15970 [Deltaproteobacteria bacterium]|nr:hypothetical protein [Deltaproteobacteria bacterium]